MPGSIYNVTNNNVISAGVQYRECDLVPSIPITPGVELHSRDMACRKRHYQQEPRL
jgi:hypothetical protein